MKKFISVCICCIMFTFIGLAQSPLLFNLDNEHAFNSINLGTPLSNFDGQLSGEEILQKSGNKQYMYTGDKKEFYYVFGVQFALLVLEFDNSNRLIGFRISQRYPMEKETACATEYSIICNKLETLYGKYTTNPYSSDGKLKGKMWEGDDVQLGVLVLDVETFGTKQLTISVRSLKLELDNNLKKLNQNIAVIDKITGFETYLFGKTMSDYSCDSWLCTKKPQNYYIGNNLVEEISLNFSADVLYAIVVKFASGDGILETLTKKYGTPLKNVVKNFVDKNLVKNIWRGDKVGIQFYSENGKYYLHYYKMTKKGLNAL